VKSLEMARRNERLRGMGLVAVNGGEDSEICQDRAVRCHR